MKRQGREMLLNWNGELLPETWEDCKGEGDLTDGILGYFLIFPQEEINRAQVSQIVDTFQKMQKCSILFLRFKKNINLSWFSFLKRGKQNKNHVAHSLKNVGETPWQFISECSQWGAQFPKAFVAGRLSDAPSEPCLPVLQPLLPLCHLFPFGVAWIYWFASND